MTTPSYSPARPRPRNGVLLLFLQMPLAAVVGGYLLDLVSLPVASFAVFVSSAFFPAWVSHRTGVSDDSSEAVHHLHRYAVRALGLVTVCTVAIAAASALTGVGSSGVWRRLGAELTGEPPSGSWALLAGVVVCTLVATCTLISALVLSRGGLIARCLAFMSRRLQAKSAPPQRLIRDGDRGTSMQVMTTRLTVAMAVAASAMVALPSAATAAPGGRSKNNFLAPCTSGTLAGVSVFIPADTGNSAYRDDGAHLRVTRFEGDFPGGTFATDFGAKQGDITCGGSVTTSQGTFTYFVTFTRVPPPRDEKGISE